MASASARPARLFLQGSAVVAKLGPDPVRQCHGRLSRLGLAEAVLQGQPEPALHGSGRLSAADQQPGEVSAVDVGPQADSAAAFLDLRQ